MVLAYEGDTAPLSPASLSATRVADKGKGEKGKAGSTGGSASSGGGPRVATAAGIPTVEYLLAQANKASSPLQALDTLARINTLRSDLAQKEAAEKTLAARAQLFQINRPRKKETYQKTARKAQEVIRTSTIALEAFKACITTITTTDSGTGSDPAAFRVVQKATEQKIAAAKKTLSAARDSFAAELEAERAARRALWQTRRHIAVTKGSIAVYKEAIATYETWPDPKVRIKAAQLIEGSGGRTAIQIPHKEFKGPRLATNQPNIHVVPGKHTVRSLAGVAMTEGMPKLHYSNTMQVIRIAAVAIGAAVNACIRVAATVQHAAATVQKTTVRAATNMRRATVAAKTQATAQAHARLVEPVVRQRAATKHAVAVAARRWRRTVNRLRHAYNGTAPQKPDVLQPAPRPDVYVFREPTPGSQAEGIPFRPGFDKKLGPVEKYKLLFDVIPGDAPTPQPAQAKPTRVGRFVNVMRMLMRPQNPVWRAAGGAGQNAALVAA